MARLSGHRSPPTPPAAYQFSNLPAGAYTVTVTPPAGYSADKAIVGSQTSGTASTGTIGNITLAPGTSGQNNDFGLIAQPASLSGFVFSELTAGSPGFNPGNPSGGEAAIAGATVTLTNSDGQVVGSPVITDATGDISIQQPARRRLHGYRHAAGRLFRRHGDCRKSDERHRKHGHDRQHHALPGTSGQNNDFGLIAQPASLSGYVFSELTVGSPGFNPGNPSGGEAAIAGATVTLTNSDGQVLKSTTTSATGAYQFVDLSAGSYTVTITTPSGYSADTAIVGSQASGSTGTGAIGNITLGNGAVGQNNDFGLLLLPASLSGYVFAEPTLGSPNFNPGNPAAGETPVAGAVVTLSNAAGSPVATTTTASTGLYLFTNLPPGTYTLTVTTPAGFTSDKAFEGTQGSGTPGITAVSNIALVGATTGDDNNFAIFTTSTNTGIDLEPEQFTVSALLTNALTVTGSYAPPPVYKTLLALQQPQLPVSQLTFLPLAIPPAGVDRLLANILGSGGDVQQTGGPLPPVTMALPGGALDKAWELFGNTRTEQWGADEPIQSLLQKLADVDEMTLVSFEFGDDVVSPIGRNLKRVTSAKPVTPQTSTGTDTGSGTRSIIRGSSSTPEIKSADPPLRAPQGQRGAKSSDTPAAPSDGSAQAEQRPWLAPLAWSAAAGAASTFVYRQRPRRRRNRSHRGLG